ncbi:MAG TPA: tRNA pseudouridine(38-40) synthase TruA [Flavobacteriales bacterium]|nr:tRNA pseudouridine(38-40) synthase TruA [Flavobacteriales bacterium]
MRYFICLSYRGSNYHGWQIQPNSNTIQAELNKALSIILEEKIQCMGCGRTDTGVHAKEFYAHFDCKKDPSADKNIIYKINGCLPPDIAVCKIYLVGPDSNARFDAISRSYRYQITQEKDVFNNDYAYYLYGTLDQKKMKKAANIILDHTDFSSFCKSKTQSNTNDCNIIDSFWEEKNGKLNFHITANRFLRGMVRTLVGTMIELGQGKLALNDFSDILLSKDRKRAGFSAPAQGLSLIHIYYPESVLKKQ